MTDPIDYSRPVGWWCTYCEEDGPCFREQTCISMGCKKIPVFLPIPKGQRPLVEDEVESAEVVTYRSTFGELVWCRGQKPRRPLLTSANWVPTVFEINYIVTGATE